MIETNLTIPFANKAIDMFVLYYEAIICAKWDKNN